MQQCRPAVVMVSIAANLQGKNLEKIVNRKFKLKISQFVSVFPNKDCRVVEK
jgi:hypothetical protein